MVAALRGRLEVEVDMKASVEHFYNFFRRTSHHLTNVCTNLHAGEIQEGEWDSASSIRKWTYPFDGRVETFREKVEFDDENKAAIHVGIEGDLFKYYRNFKCTFQRVPKPEGSVAKVIIEYEKLSEDMPYPTNYLDLLVTFTKDINAHLMKP